MFHSPVRITLHRPDRAPDVERWSRGESPGTLLKENGGRAVWRVPTGASALYVKRFPRELLRDRARKEARLLADLEKAGIAGPRLVAVARDQVGSYVLTEEIPDTRPLGDAIQADGRQGCALLERLGALARRLHDAGFEHQDFHVGNVLERKGELFVIDVHRAKQWKKIPRARRLDGLAFTALSFSETRPLTDLLRFLRGYGLRAPADWIDVWNRLRKRRDRYYRGRQARCLKEGSGFGIQGKTVYRKGVDVAALLERVRSGPAALIKERKGETLRRVDGSLFVKQPGPARARRIWINAHGLSIRGIDTPKLYAWNGPWVAGEWVEAVDLHEHIQRSFGSLSRAARAEFLHRLARIVRRMHDRGIYHADLKAGNVLVGSSRIVVIDLDRVSFSAELPEKRRLYNLAQLNAAVAPPLTRTDRLRFLDAYIGRCRSLRERRSRWAAEIMRLSVARAHRWPPR